MQLIQKAKELQTKHRPFNEFASASCKSDAGDTKIGQQWEFLDSLSHESLLQMNSLIKQESDQLKHIVTAPYVSATLNEKQKPIVSVESDSSSNDDDFNLLVDSYREKSATMVGEARPRLSSLVRRDANLLKSDLITVELCDSPGLPKKQASLSPVPKPKALKTRESKIVLDNSIKFQVRHNTNASGKHPIEIKLSGFAALKQNTIKIDPQNFPKSKLQRKISKLIEAQKGKQSHRQGAQDP